MQRSIEKRNESQLLRFPAKQIRARVIAEYVRAAGYRGVVVFTCGNAAKALRDQQGLEVVEVGPRGDLKTGKWFTQAEIHRLWPDLFDATSGHLSVPLMGDIAKAFREHLGNLPARRYAVPTGSGETITCLRIAYPLLTFDAEYDDSKPETAHDPDAPLNAIVEGESLPVSEQEKKDFARKMAKYGQLVTAMPPSLTNPERSEGGVRRGRFLLAFTLGVAVLMLVIYLANR